MAEDIKHTIEAFKAMGVDIRLKAPCSRLKARTIQPSAFSLQPKEVIITGVGMRGLKKPARPLYLGNSGTTMRILPGILAGQDFEAILTGDASLSNRPMKRIVDPLEKMGAKIRGSSNSRGHLSVPYCLRQEVYPPLKIRGGKLKAIRYNSKIASGQVKSCILFAGLYAGGVTSVKEPERSRDHTERMLKIFGCRLKVQCSRVSVKGPVKLKSPGVIEIPGDISSAAFFIVAGCILPGVKITIKNIGLNPTRVGVIDILKKMRANIFLQPRASSLEPKGDIIIQSSVLKGVTISPKEVIRAIDEIPVIMVAACFAKGKTIIKGIEELRVKETDRIKSMVTNLRKIGADIRLRKSPSSRGHLSVPYCCSRFKGKIQPTASSLETEREYIVINGGRPLHGARVSSFGDHRTAMSMMVAGLGTKGKIVVTGLGCINKSFPGFERLLHKLN